MLLNWHVKVQMKGAFVMRKMGTEEYRQLWISRICDLNDSEMTQEEWSKQHGIAYSTLRYWISKLKKEAVSENSEANWLKVDMMGNEVAAIRIPDTETNNNSIINIRFGDFTVELQNGCDSQRVFELLRMLKAL